MRHILLEFALKRPIWVIALVLLATLGFALQFPQVNFDNDPEKMLAADEPVRVFHNEIKHKYALYDFVVVGIVNEDDPHGVFNVATLQRIDRLTHQLIYLKRGDDGMPHIALPGADAGQSIDLTPDSRWERVLNFAFGHSPNDLFTSSGSSAIVAQEILSPSVVDNIKQAQLGSLKLEYRMERPPRSQQQALEIRDDAIKLFAGANVFSGGMTIPFSASFRITPMFTLECVIATEPAKSLKLQTEPIFTGHICAKRQQNFRTDSFHALLPSQHCPTV